MLDKLFGDSKTNEGEKADGAVEKNPLQNEAISERERASKKRKR